MGIQVCLNLDPGSINGIMSRGQSLTYAYVNIRLQTSLWTQVPVLWFCIWAILRTLRFKFVQIMAQGSKFNIDLYRKMISKIFFLWTV